MEKQKPEYCPVCGVRLRVIVNRSGAYLECPLDIGKFYYEGPNKGVKTGVFL